MGSDQTSSTTSVCRGGNYHSIGKRGRGRVWQGGRGRALSKFGVWGWLAGRRVQLGLWFIGAASECSEGTGPCSALSKAAPPPPPSLPPSLQARARRLSREVEVACSLASERGMLNATKVVLWCSMAVRFPAPSPSPSPKTSCASTYVGSYVHMDYTART